jgi:hypothetical protein
MRIETRDNEVIIWGTMVGTTFSEEDQKEIVKWFIQNKPELVRECRKDLRTLIDLKKSLKQEP